MMQFGRALDGLAVTASVVLLAACAAADDSTVGARIDAVPDVCAPVGFGSGGTAWASSCDGRSIINLDSGDTRELQCESDSALAKVEEIFPVGSDAVALFVCYDHPLDARTMLQSLDANPVAPAVFMGLSVHAVETAVYSSAGQGVIILQTGKCNGLVIYRLESGSSLEGEAVPVSAIKVGGVEFVLDGGQSYGLAPPCTELAAVRGLGASADGDSVAFALVQPAKASIYERPMDMFVGPVSIEDSPGDGSVALLGDMATVAEGVMDDFAFPIGVFSCGGDSELLVSEGGRLAVRSSGDRRVLSLVPEHSWAGFALSESTRSVLVLAAVDFASGDVYRATDLSLC